MGDQIQYIRKLADSMVGFVQGPWVFDGDQVLADGGLAGSTPVATVHKEFRAWKGNGDLIAKAPQLYLGLCELLAAYDRLEDETRTRALQCARLSDILADSIMTTLAQIEANQVNGMVPTKVVRQVIHDAGTRFVEVLKGTPK